MKTEQGSKTVASIYIGRWTPKVLFSLKEKPYRHGRLRRRIGSISQRMLTRTLRNLESTGLIVRRVTRTFVATSDLCRSFAILSLLGLVPATVSAFRAYGLGQKLLLACIAAVLVSLLLYWSSWRRMVRFREHIRDNGFPGVLGYG